MAEKEHLNRLLLFILSNEKVSQELKKYDSKGQKIIIEIIRRTLTVSDLELSIIKKERFDYNVEDLVYTLDILSSITPTSIKSAVIDILKDING